MFRIFWVLINLVENERVEWQSNHLLFPGVFCSHI